VRRLRMAISGMTMTWRGKRSPTSMAAAEPALGGVKAVIHGLDCAKVPQAYGHF
jgi:hypothetical protein